MKKLLWIPVILLVGFIALVYLSVSVGNKTLVTAEINTAEDMERVDFEKHDSVFVAASTLYRGNFLKNFMQGENFREAWATPVRFPVVYLDTLFGGLKVVKEGGGSQTHSLRLKSESGVTYSLRSINKYPDSHIPEFAKNLGLENIVQDGISAQHPYGAVPAAALAEEAGLLHTHPVPVFIPNQEVLGKYNNKYGNKLFLLEFETEGESNWTTLENVTGILDTEDLQELKKEQQEKLQIDKNLLVRARLFDLLIGDWDRHANQWGWVLQKKNNKYRAIPLAGDRDNAFFKLEGLVPGIITSENIQPLVRPFEAEIDYLPGLVYPFDVYFLKNVPEEVFMKEAEFLQKVITDEEIEAALKVWPPQIYDLNGEEIASKIKQRKEDLLKYATAFYKIIQEKPLLTKPLKGSEDLELNQALMNCFDCLD